MADLASLRGIDPRIGVGLGVIDVKANRVETPDDVAQALQRATMLIGEGRIRWAHPDCGFWMLKRSVVDRKIAALVKGRDLFLGRS